jgi:hypothetical protein
MEDSLTKQKTMKIQEKKQEQVQTPPESVQTEQKPVETPVEPQKQKKNHDGS